MNRHQRRKQKAMKKDETPTPKQELTEEQKAQQTLQKAFEGRIKEASAKWDEFQKFVNDSGLQMIFLETKTWPEGRHAGVAIQFAPRPQ